MCGGSTQYGQKKFQQVSHHQRFSEHYGQRLLMEVVRRIIQLQLVRTEATGLLDGINSCENTGTKWRPQRT